MHQKTLMKAKVVDMLEMLETNGFTVVKAEPCKHLIKVVIFIIPTVKTFAF